MKKLNRWVYAIVGVIVLIFAGLIYAWSVLASPIAASTGWQPDSMSLTFTIAMSFFCLGGLAGGLLNGKINVRINVIAAAILFLLGFFITSRTSTIAMLYFGFGVCSGFASGLAYNAVMSTISKWFPDKQGLISGILLMGFGLGAFIIGKVYTAYTPEGPEFQVWRSSFLVLGIIIFIVLLIGSVFFIKPDPDYNPGVTKTVKSKTSHFKEEGIDVGPSVMLRRPSFWMYFIWAIALSAAGLALVSQASNIITMQVAPSTDAGTVATVAGLVSIFNGVGRIIFGGMYDKFGRKITMLSADFTFVIFIAALLLAMTAKSFPILVISYILGGLAYSSVTPTNSAFINAFYGATHYPVNFPMVNLNLIIASFSSTIAGSLYTATGSFMSTCFMIIGLVVVGFITTFMIRKP